VDVNHVTLSHLPKIKRNVYTIVMLLSVDKKKNLQVTLSMDETHESKDGQGIAGNSSAETIKASHLSIICMNNIKRRNNIYPCCSVQLYHHA